SDSLIQFGIGIAGQFVCPNAHFRYLLVKYVSGGPLFTLTFTPAFFACCAKIVADSSIPAIAVLEYSVTVRFSWPACLSRNLALSMSWWRCGMSFAYHSRPL